MYSLPLLTRPGSSLNPSPMEVIILTKIYSPSNLGNIPNKEEE